MNDPLPDLESPLARLHFAIALRRIQLEAAYREYLKHFGGRSSAAAYEHVRAAGDAKLLPPDYIAQLPPCSLILSAIRMARELNALEEIARLGPFHDVPAKVAESLAAAATRPKPTANAPAGDCKDNSPAC